MTTSESATPVAPTVVPPGHVAKHGSDPHQRLSVCGVASIGTVTSYPWQHGSGGGGAGVGVGGGGAGVGVGGGGAGVGVGGGPPGQDVTTAPPHGSKIDAIWTHDPVMLL